MAVVCAILTDLVTDCKIADCDFAFVNLANNGLVG